MSTDRLGLLGQQVGSFRLQRVLGARASAVVHAGENVAVPGIFRALKVLRPELSSQPEFRRRFHRECLILERLRHRHIVQFFGAHEDAQHPVLVTEFELLRGESPSALLSRTQGPRPLSAAPAARLVAVPAEEDGALPRLGRRGVGPWLGLGAVVAGLGVWVAAGLGCGGGPSEPPSSPAASSLPSLAAVFEPCPAGQSRRGDTGEHCCWPGQGWSSSRGQCVGAPTSCPEGEEVKGEACVPKPERSDADSANLDWVVIAPGSFEMGWEDGEWNDKPVHRVTLSAYALARTETTVAQYAACVDAKGCEVPARCTSGYEGHTWDKVATEQHPVNCVSWSQAAAFCAWAGGRLPTEAEWEYGARGPAGRKYPWGETSPAAAGAPVCNMHGLDDGFSGTAPVGSFPAGRSPAGLDDMAGNVCEWVADWYGPYQAAEATDPTGAASGSERVGRGGCFYSHGVAGLRGASRYTFAPSDAVTYLGFRCARSFP